MNPRRTFIRLSSAFVAAPWLAPLAAWAQKEQRLQNWARNLTYSTANVSSHRTVDELRRIVRAQPKLKALGTRHCFNTIADSRDHLLSMRAMTQVLAIDEAARTVTVEGGINYGELCPALDAKGLALHNLASLPHISVAGACTTATHGSGVTNGNLATAVTALELVTADGSIVTLSKEKDGERFQAAVVGLGALGVVTKVTLALQPAFRVRQRVFERLPLAQLKDHFDEIVSAGYSVSLFTDWQQDSINEVWIKSRADDASAARIEQASAPGADFFGARPAAKNLHPIAALSAENCTAQMGVPGPWYERLPHFRMGFTPSSGTELQAEYFVPRRHAVEAILAVQRMGRRIGPHLFISEIRTIDADALWMSPCYKQPSVTIHFTWKQEWDAVRALLLPDIERELAPFDARPHWGKLFTLPPATLQARYARLAEFRTLAAELDPRGKFRNAFLDTNVFGA